GGDGGLGGTPKGIDGTPGAPGAAGEGFAGLDGAAGLGTSGGPGVISVTNYGSIVTRGIGSAGIRVIGDGLATVTNDGGTISASFSTDGGLTIHRGIAIDTTNDTALIQLKGTQGDGHIFGDIDLAPGDTIEVTQGKTFFDGTIHGASPGTLLDIFDNG